MSAENIKEVVQEKYGQAALRVHSGGRFLLRSLRRIRWCCDPITTNLYDVDQAQPDSGGGAQGIAGVRQPNCACPIEARRNRTRPRFRRRHRRAAFGQARRARREKLTGLI